jgi:hypothetical protein
VNAEVTAVTTVRDVIKDDREIKPVSHDPVIPFGPR